MGSQILLQETSECGSYAFGVPQQNKGSQRLASSLQLAILSTSLCRRSVIFGLDAPWQAIARSSAYTFTKVASSNYPRRSLMTMLKRSGDGTNPCGRLPVKFRLLPRVQLTITLASRLVSQARTHSTNRGAGGGILPASAVFVEGHSSTLCRTPSNSRRATPPFSLLPGTRRKQIVIGVGFGSPLPRGKEAHLRITTRLVGSR